MIRTALIARLRAAGCVFAEDEAELLIEAEPDDAAAREALVARRVAGEPLEIVLGWAGFGGHRIRTAPGVFVPRRRTEELAWAAIDRCPPGGVLVDLCCGTGAIGTVAGGVRPDIEVHCADVDPVATRCAQENLADLLGQEGAKERVHTGDLFSALPGRLLGRVDVVAANVPYVPTSVVALLPREAREYEPAHSLDGGPDGLNVLTRVMGGLREWLTPGGVALSEISGDQLVEASRQAEMAGLALAVDKHGDDTQVIMLRLMD